MATLAGMDLGYGSQVKLVRTNYLLLGNIDASGTTAQAYANALQMYNNVMTQRQSQTAAGSAGAKQLLCDYVLTINDNGNGSSAAASTLASNVSGTDPVVVQSITTLPVLGPSTNAISGVSGDGIVSGVNDSAAALGTSFTHEVLAVLNIGSLTFAGANFTTPTALDLLAGTSGTSLLYSELLADNVNGPVDTIDATAAITDLIGTSGLGALHTASQLDLTNTNFTTAFVGAGNAAGTTATAFGGVAATTVAAATCGLLSVLTLVKLA